MSDITFGDFEVFTIDDAMPAVGVSLSKSALSVREGGATDTYTVALSHAPTADVVVTVSPDSQLSTSPSQLTFTAANWNLPQTVAVSAVQDGIAEGNHSGTIVHAVTSADTRYNGLAVNSVTASIADPVPPTLTLPALSGGFLTQSGMSLSGSAAPGATVTVYVNNLSTGETRAVSVVADANGNWSIALADLSDGTYEMQVQSGGVQSEKVTIAVDSHAPVSTATITSSFGPKASGWYAGTVSVALSAADGAGGSGVLRIEASLDNGPWTAVPATGLEIAAEGNHTLCYRSVDRAGNVEAARCMPLPIDATAPQVNPAFDAVSNVLNLNAQDVLSGIASVEISRDAGATWTAQAGPVNFTRDGSHTVHYRVADKAGNLSSGQTTVLVVTPPVITAPVNQTASEAVGQNLNLGTFTDLPGDSPWSVDVDWGDGSAHAAFVLTATGPLGTQMHTYADSGTYTVTVKVTDQAGNSGSKSFPVAVSNTAPTAVIAAGGPINEGGTVTVALNNPADVSSVDAQTGFRYAFACPGASLAGATYANSSLVASASCAFDDSGTYAVRARIIDKDDGFSEYTAAVAVRNVAPAAVLNIGGPVGEGSAAAISFSGQSDVSRADTLAGFRYAYACDGGSLAGATYANSGTAASASCAYADGPAAQPVRARIIDKDDGFTEYAGTVTVNNVAPVVGSVTAPVDPLLVNTVIQASASFADAGVLDTHAASIDWGDGTRSSGVVTEANGAGAVTGSHAYAAGGTYTVTVTVTDKDGGAGSARFQSVIVYDPAGASVNGTGRIASPAGAMPGDPGATGQARLKMKADYKGGASLPTGDMSFEFKGGNLAFQSTGYAWLAASGKKATLKGTGTLNGSGAYGFVLSVTEGSNGAADAMRIKIWDAASGQVVYDSQPGTSDFADPAAPVSGGNIAVH